MAWKSVPHRRSGFTLLEVCVAAIVMVILFTQAAPKFWEATEQHRVDLAGARLMMINTAQRLYFADNSAFATDLTALNNANLLDSQMPPGNGDDGKFTYSVTAGVTPPTFTATATRNTNTYWSGSISIGHAGVFSGWINNSDSSIKLTPPSTSNGL